MKSVCVSLAFQAVDTSLDMNLIKTNQTINFGFILFYLNMVVFFLIKYTKVVL